ncbi:hypothetical protein SporoP8_12095 [Sporosarcina ureae]|uniref:S-layer homology domain-containing protein n=1 Tax=Sporosarcina ureae TaxID=1571 RepID=UPI000A162B6F|nr:S-layer homology domain-containing protein [Sporosarcina ureae]ARJ39550.1 hypothetical protein SporoP8_12095 [Sporosarcina ureae]
MANQPTKYRKFVVGAASAALVASAVAPVAMAATFTDVKDNNSHKEAIDALSNAGVISGYEDGTFKPNKTLTRSDVVKLMGKWLVSEGYKVPTDYKTKPRFSDLKTTSNDELLKMSALVYDNGVFVGKPDGSLDPTGDITRENMAIVLVRAFDRVHDVDLTSYVKDQDFKKDVTDLGKAKAEARPAIDVLDFFDITNPAAPEFNPKSTTTRGQFASFLYKTTKVDFDEIGGVVAPGVASVTAVNSTTVEVKMKEKVENINSLKFTIDGLTVSNAAVKQSDDKTVVLTTAVQKGGEKYTVMLDGKAIGSFNGVSPTVPSKISLNTKTIQGVVGQQVILSADTGVKEAGIPVTFNVKAETNTTLNKDQVFEVVTNADGIATFSYTQYNAGEDTVTVYPTGKAELREQGKVYWANAAQLTIKDITEATTLANGSKKVYEINSARNAGGYVFVTFKENLNVTPDKLVKTVTAEGVSTHTVDPITGKPGVALGANAYPYKASTSGENVIAVKLDASGKANLVLTGSNATVTPIVYEGSSALLGESNPALYNAKYSATARQATATPVTFKVQQTLGLTINAEGVQNAATYKNATQTGGRDYALTFNTQDGKAAAPGTKVNVLIDTENVTGTLHVLDADNKEVTGYTTYENGKKRVYTVEIAKDGKAKFTVSSDKENDYVAPVAFIDNGKTTGQLDADDLQAAGEITYFVEKVNYTANLKAVDKDGKKVSTVIANGEEAATFVYQLVDQNGKPRSSTDATTVSFEVQAGTGNITANGTPITAGTTKTVPAVISAGQTEATVKVVAATPTTATVTATGSKAGVVLPTTNPSSVSVNFSQYGAAAITGVVSNINPTLEVLTINNTVYSYANAAAYQIKGSAVTKTAFVNEVAAGSKTVSVTVDSDGKFTFNVVDAVTPPGAASGLIKSAKAVNPTTIEVTFSESVTLTNSNLKAGQFGFDLNNNGVIDAGEYATAVSNSPGTKLTFTVGTMTESDFGKVVYTPALATTDRLMKTAGSEYVSETLTLSNEFTTGIGSIPNSLILAPTTANSTPGVAGTKQVETLTLAAAGGFGPGNFTIAVTDGTKAYNVATVTTTLNESPASVALKAVTELKKDTDLAAKYEITTAGGNVVLTAKEAATNDGALNAVVTDVNAGVTPVTTSTNTTNGAAGTASVSTTQVANKAAVGDAKVKLAQTSSALGNFNKEIAVTFDATDATDNVTTAAKIAAVLNADTDVAAKFTVSAATDTISVTNKKTGVVTATTLEVVQ